MSYTADRRLSLFLKQKGAFFNGVAHVPLKQFLTLATSIVQDMNNTTAVSASKMVRKHLLNEAWHGIGRLYFFVFLNGIAC